MKYGFETDPFWRTKLVRDHDPIEYFEQKLKQPKTGLSVRYTQIRKNTRKPKPAPKPSKTFTPAPEKKSDLLDKEGLLELIRKDGQEAHWHIIEHKAEYQQNDWFFDDDLQEAIRRIK